MKRIGKYQYADNGRRFVLTLAGMECSQCRRAFLALEDPAIGLGKVPAHWIDNGYVNEVLKDGQE